MERNFHFPIVRLATICNVCKSIEVNVKTILQNSICDNIFTMSSAYKRKNYVDGFWSIIQRMLKASYEWETTMANSETRTIFHWRE